MIAAMRGGARRDALVRIGRAMLEQTEPNPNYGLFEPAGVDASDGDDSYAPLQYVSRDVEPFLKDLQDQPPYLAEFQQGRVRRSRRR